MASHQSWIKLHTDMLYDPKILRLHPIGRFAWVGLLLMARGGDPAGTWQARSREALAQDLACVLRLDDALDDDPTMDHVASAVVEWERSGMVTIGVDGLLTVTNWDKRQGDLRPSSHPEQTRERKRLSRMSRDVTQGHAVSRGVTTEERRVEEKRESAPLPPTLDDFEEQTTSPTAVASPVPVVPVPEAVRECPLCLRLLSRLNDLTLRGYSLVAPGGTWLHDAHHRFGVEACEGLIDRKCRAWLHDRERNGFLTPKVLFKPQNVEQWIYETEGRSDSDGPKRLSVADLAKLARKGRT